MLSKKLRVALVCCGLALVAPVAMALTADTASATGYAVEFDAFGNPSCNPGTAQSCNVA